MDKGSCCEAVFSYLYKRTGMHVSESNRRMVERFLEKKARNITLARYLQLLEQSHSEYYDLLEVFTIGETYFFREEKYFHLLFHKLLPEYRKKSLIPPAIWSAAAATGEEAYSLAMMVKHIWGPAAAAAKPILATDINVRALENLRLASYSKNSLRKDGSGFHNLLYDNAEIVDSRITLHENILKLVKSFELNLINADYRISLGCSPDIIFICNVLIYMNRSVREQIIDKAVSILNSGGYLILSTSNTAFVEHPQLELHEEKNAYYFKKKQ